jgi:GNAT superfamily N-acetyltransferase
MAQPFIREARPGDESGLHEAHMRSIREICVHDHGEDEVRGWGNRPLGNRWVDAIKNGFVWAVELNSKICGHGYIRIYKEDGETYGHIHGLYLTPEVLKQGFGHQLMLLMLEKARKSGAKVITLDSTITAHEFYKRYGFADTGPMKKQEIGGYPVSGFPMALTLG